LRQYNCIPVFIKDETLAKANLHHEHVIKPLFHNFKQFCEPGYGNKMRDLQMQAYHEINQVFANTVAQNLHSLHHDATDDPPTVDKIIWIHNTHLLLLPTLLRRKNSNVNIGFSLHSPWPSTDIYKMLPQRLEIMKSLLCADLISFHMFEYARNFYTGAARLLDLRKSFR
jgi:trehalose 6-phosphate synthase/phosphatase